MHHLVMSYEVWNNSILDVCMGIEVAKLQQAFMQKDEYSSRLNGGVYAKFYWI